jgi:hypothetical protein
VKPHGHFNNAIKGALSMAIKHALGRWRLVKLIVPVWITSFFLHFAWEMWQIHFFANMADAPHAAAVLVCTQATFGDANIALFAYLAAAVSVRSIAWLGTPSAQALVVYLLTGMLITVLLEHLATEVWGRWHYNARMPRLPIVGTGLLPLMQWIVVPVLTVYIARLIYFGFVYLQQSSAQSPQSRMVDKS